MIIKLSINILISTFLISNLYGVEKANVEHGKHYGEYKKTDDNKTKKKKMSIEESLMELVKLSKKQVNLQTEIRDILRNEYDPSPKYMTLPNGEKCIENSSKKCFKMPMINEIKGIPAIANALQLRDLKSVKVKELWYDKYLTEVFKLAYLKGQAQRELGPKLQRPQSPSGTISASNGINFPMEREYRKNLIIKHSDNFELNVFLGVNSNLDMFSLYPLAKLAMNFKELKINLIFENEKQKNRWESMYDNFFAGRYLKDLPSFIQPELFKELDLYTSPSVFLKDKKLDKDTFIFKGRIYERPIIRRMINYMVQNKHIKANELSTRNAWADKSGEKTVKRHIERDLGIKYED